MSTAAVHQVTISTRTLVVALAAFAVALALAISLPLVLRTSHTVLVRVPATAQTSSQTSSPGSSVTTDSQLRMGDDTPISRAETDSQTRMSP